MIENHVKHTDSEKGKEVLANFDEYVEKFKKVIPADYKKLLSLIGKYEEQGESRENAEIEAFYESIGKKKGEGV